ncbi:MAG: NAD-dependent epimerase/dehydratase family protein [Pyrinomonadaceae bacterium]|nr:NAD-dependent epimerase/dehydratase family protein [Sphingobacteriaceae bacterium]
MKKVIIAGASGLIGSELLSLLLGNKNITEVVTLVRKPLNLTHNKLVQIPVNFDSLDSYKSDIQGDVFYCCLGTTKYKTPDLRDYRKVDFDYPLALAQMAAQNDISQFHFVSAMGANVNSTVFYTKLKGDIEYALKQLTIQSLHIYQPALLTGKRLEERKNEKMAVAIMKIVDPLLIGPLAKYKSIPAATVAMAMQNQTFKNMMGVHTYTSDIIKKLA